MILPSEQLSGKEGEIWTPGSSISLHSKSLMLILELHVHLLIDFFFCCFYSPLSIPQFICIYFCFKKKNSVTKKEQSQIYS